MRKLNAGRLAKIAYRGKHLAVLTRSEIGTNEGKLKRKIKRKRRKMSETYNNLQLQVDHLRSQRQRFEKTKHSLAGNLKSESIGMETKINSSEACTLETRVGTTKLRNRDDWGSGPFDGASYDYDIA